MSSKKIIECVPNFSVGKNGKIIEIGQETAEKEQK